LFLADQHCNSRGLVHGGLITALADNAMGLSCAAAMKADGREVKGLVTISLNADFMGMAKTGQWLEIKTDHVKCGGSVCFARALVVSDGQPIAQTSATFKIV
jgi:uncharacterized protein (TIGR00369 family)